MSYRAISQSALRIAFALFGSCILTAAVYFASPFVQLAEIEGASERGDGRTLTLFLVPANIQQSLHGSHEICKNWMGIVRTPALNRCKINVELLAGAFRNADLNAGPLGGTGATWSAFRYRGLDCFLATRISLANPAKVITFRMARIDAFRRRLVAVQPRRKAAQLQR